MTTPRKYDAIAEESDSLNNNDVMESSRFGKKFSIWNVKAHPRRSIGTIKERLKFSRVQARRQRSSSSDTALSSRALTQTWSSRFKSAVTLQSTKSQIVKISPTTQRIPVTKWSRKLYGSDKAVMAEREKLERVGQFVIHPYSNFRMSWDIFSALLILANIIIIPMDIAFSGPTEDIRNVVFKLFSDSWFMLDIVLNFRTGIQSHGDDITTIELRPRKIARLYLRSWFALDLIASTPFDHVFRLFIDPRESKAVRFLRIVKALSIIRIARIPRLVRGLHNWEEIFNLQYDSAVSMLRFAYLVFIIFLTCHINGCLQYMVPMFYDFPNDTWVKMRGLDHPNVTWWEAYSWSLFKSTSHMLCLGFSQVIPVGLIDLWLTMYSQMIGAVIFAMFLGNAINLMQEMDATQTAYKMKITQIEEYLGFRRVPLKLKHAVLDYCEMRFQGKIFNEQEILKELNSELRREVVQFNTADLIVSVPLFEDVSDDFVYEIGARLKYAVYLLGEVIVKEGTPARHMYFISRGEVEIRTTMFSDSLSDGAHFGEGSLFGGEVKRSADVVALSTVHMYILSRSNYVEVLDKYPEDARRINTYARTIKDRSSRYDFVRAFDS